MRNVCCSSNLLQRTFFAAAIASSSILTGQASADDAAQNKEIQKALNYLGYDAGHPDGLRGMKTNRAIEQFTSKLPASVTIADNSDLLGLLSEQLSPAELQFKYLGRTKEFVLAQSQGNRLIRYLYPVDLDQDGTEELVIAGFESQAIKHTNLSGAKIGIFEWRELRLVLATDKWLEKKDQIFIGVGDLVSGDFNGDGETDLFLSAYSDSDTDVTTNVLYNEGGSFRRSTLDIGDWQHGATSGDIDGDGYTDVFASGYHKSDSLYLGSPEGLIKYRWASGSYAGGSGAVIGRYLPGNDALLIIVDNARNTESTDEDTNLYRIDINKHEKTAKLKKISSLPRSTFEHHDWDSYFSKPVKRSHDIRARSVDFDKDGLLDVLVFSVNVAGSTLSGERLSSIQFLRNKGMGAFEDVTDEKLFGFNYASHPSYAPILRDFDGDGDIDIFLSEHDYDGLADSTDILLQDSYGRYVSVGNGKFGQAMPGSANEDISTILKGPGGNEYLVKHTQTSRGYGAKEVLEYYELQINSR